MARYVYMIVSVTTDMAPGLTNIPNLGLHCNRKDAIDHFLACVNSRARSGESVIWTHNEPHPEPIPGCTVIRESYVKRKDCRENIRLERWKLT